MRIFVWARPDACEQNDDELDESLVELFRMGFHESFETLPAVMCDGKVRLLKNPSFLKAASEARVLLPVVLYQSEESASRVTLSETLAWKQRFSILGVGVGERVCEKDA